MSIFVGYCDLNLWAKDYISLMNGILFLPTKFRQDLLV